MKIGVLLSLLVAGAIAAPMPSSSQDDRRRFQRITLELDHDDSVGPQAAYTSQRLINHHGNNDGNDKNDLTNYRSNSAGSDKYEQQVNSGGNDKLYEQLFQDRSTRQPYNIHQRQKQHGQDERQDYQLVQITYKPPNRQQRTQLTAGGKPNLGFITLKYIQPITSIHQLQQLSHLRAAIRNNQLRAGLIPQNRDDDDDDDEDDEDNNEH